jgi:hypothetical protein
MLTKQIKAVIETNLSVGKSYEDIRSILKMDGHKDVSINIIFEEYRASLPNATVHKEPSKKSVIPLVLFFVTALLLLAGFGYWFFVLGPGAVKSPEELNFINSVNSVNPNSVNGTVNNNEDFFRDPTSRKTIVSTSSTGVVDNSVNNSADSAVNNTVNSAVNNVVSDLVETNSNIDIGAQNVLIQSSLDNISKGLFAYTANLSSYDGICDQASGILNGIKEIAKSNSLTGDVICTTSSSTWMIAVPLLTPGEYHCMDSSKNSFKTKRNLTGQLSCI